MRCRLKCWPVKGFVEYTINLAGETFKIYFPQSVHNLHYCIERNKAFAPFIKCLLPEHRGKFFNVPDIVFQCWREILYYKGQAIALILLKQTEHFPLGKLSTCHYCGYMFLLLPLYPRFFNVWNDLYRNVMNDHGDCIIQFAL